MDRDVERVLKTGTILELQACYAQRRLSVFDAIDWFLKQIERLNNDGPAINAVREISPTVLDDATRADAAIRAGRTLGLLHGIPVLIKDNILTADGMAATAGAAAFKDYRPRHEATIVQRLRDAGAIILGKTNMTEFADYVSDFMPSAFSGAGGVVINPHSGPFDRGQGSSVGSAAAVAAAFAPVAIGSETQNSIQTPALHASVVGFKPTVGRTSRTHVVPLVPSQDSPGPIARCIADAALVASVISGADMQDGATSEQSAFAALPKITLDTIRLGVPRVAMANRDDIRQTAGSFAAVLSRLADAGVTIVDPCDLPSAEQLMNLRSSVFRTEFKAALNVFLAENDVPSGVRSLGELIAWNEAHPDIIPFGQTLLLAAEATVGLNDPAYLADRALDITLSRTQGIDAACANGGCDALIVPMSVAAKCTGKAGAPVIALPAGADTDGAPFGVTLFSPCGTDERLLAIAAAIEPIIVERLAPKLLY
ncbi:amidase family protein [Aliirhizobium smilacinae]|uniref:Amidase n=1 Tax=Aliirhizobium smilacinae TaxID=1395944 RepID=A0A5C4XJ73_9HYPH|nr:amidase family protein [Rhizobium smilacinae]TNM63466.1 amidase [Rhizobium smilacinae]